MVARRRRLRGSRSHGFTLMELLVVVALLAIMGSIAMVSLDDGGAAAVDLARMQVQDTVATAQAMAASKRLAHGVVFDPDGDTYALVDADGEVVTDPITHQPYLVDLTAVTPTIDVVSADFGTAGAAILFDAQGVPVDGGTLVLRRDRATRTLTLDAATGDLE